MTQSAVQSLILSALAASLHRPSPYHAFLVLIGCLCGVILIIAVLIAYSRPSCKPVVNQSARALESQGFLVSTSYRAARAFRVDEHQERGPHYFLELEEDGILHLCGHYLFDLEPGESRPGSGINSGPARLRHFPCTEFTVRRHRDTGEAVDILCRGLVIEPEIEAPPYSRADFHALRVPADGDILHNISFDQLIEQRIGPHRLN